MRQLAEIGPVRRTTGSRYEITNFGLAVTAGKFNARPAQPDATVTDYGTIKQSHDSVGNVDQPTPIPTGRTHELKTDPIVFDAVLSRRKTFEIRYNDRDYHTGDTLILRRTRYTGDEMLSGEPLIYVGNPLPVTITYMMHGPAYGLAPGWVIMGIAPAQPAPIKTGPSGKTMWTATMPDRRKKPAPIPAVNQRCEIGIYGKSWDGPEATRAYTHEHQPDNVVASRLGRAVYKARQHTPGDHIDLGLYLLRELMDVGFGVFELPRPAAHGGE
ncbi:MAG: DUF3850 domain-containing protein [Gammaproteobacteria bacterium]|nr:DUF3850 domain-containing protein [Gammaproteobacteria bacterium]